MTVTSITGMDLVHGYTVADVERLAKSAARIAGGRSGQVFSEARDTARSGVLIALYETVGGARPAEHDLVQAGVQLLLDDMHDDQRHRGVAKHSKPAPNFTKFWLAVEVEAQDGFTDKLVERLAIPQVLGQVSQLDYDTIAALVIEGTGPAAAAALGISPGTFKQRLFRARQRFIEAWYDTETPPLPPDLTKTCRSGHSKAVHGHQDGKGAWRCRLCERNYRRRMYTKTGSYQGRVFEVA